MMASIEENDDDDDDYDWLARKNQAWVEDEGHHAMYWLDHYEGKIYFYKEREDYPDNPEIWYAGESIGTWSPKSNTFMWACDNKTAREASNKISESGKRWFAENGGFTGSMLPNITSLELAWSVIAIAARLSNVVAVYRAPATCDDVKDELAAMGRRVTTFNKNKILNHEFFAITSNKHEIL